MTNVFLSLNEYFGSKWPSFLPTWPDPAPLDHVWIEPPQSTTIDGKVQLNTSLLFENELVANLPNLDAVSIVLAPGGGNTIIPLEADVSSVFELRIIQIPVTLRLSPTFFKPVRQIQPTEPNKPVRYELDPNVTQVEVVLGQITLKINSTGDIDFLVESNVTIPPFMIGDSGIVVEATHIQPHLTSSALPQAYKDKLNLPIGWHGFLFERASVTLPSDFDLPLPDQLVFEYCAIGEGGFSGTVAFIATTPIEGDILGSSFELKSVSLTFVQNGLTKSEIAGGMTLPFFDDPINLKLGLSNSGGFEGELDTSGKPLKLKLPGMSDPFTIEKPQFALNTTGDDRCAALSWDEPHLKQLLRAISPSLDDKTAGSTSTQRVTLRIILGEPVREVRLDWMISGLQTLALPGVRVEIPSTSDGQVGKPPNTMLSLIFGAGNRTLDYLSLVLTFAAMPAFGTPGADGKFPENQDHLRAYTTFAWGRDGDRELHNEDDSPKPPDPFFDVRFRTRKRLSMVLLDLKLGEAKLPRFLQQLETDLSQLDLNNTETLCGSTAFATKSLAATDWEGKFLVSDQFTPPFLKQNDTNEQKNQFAQFLDISRADDGNLIEIDFAKTLLELRFKVMLTFGPISLASTIEVKFNWETFALDVDHDFGLDMFSEKAELAPQEHLGLTWRLKGKKVDEGKYHYFTLVTKNYNYQVQMAQGAVFELEYTKASDEPIVFAISNFVLSPKGIDLTAGVTDRPARLNGIDTRFRFGGSSIEIKENTIKDFTLAGSGPLPPALVGDAMADIALQFSQRNGKLELVKGHAQLQGNKLLHCEGTRFQFQIDALGLDFVNDGKFHLYFKVTGSAQFVLGSGDDTNGALALLPKIKIDLVECPLTGDASVIAKHIKFLIEFPKPISFNFLGAFEFELRAIGFIPQAKEFDNDGAMELTGQLRFAQGIGDTPDSRHDYHRMLVGLPEKGKLFPRIYFKRVAVNINIGAAFKLQGVVEFVDDTNQKGFLGEGMIQIQGLPSLAASFGFLRVRRDENSPWVRAWFFYLEVRRVSLMIPVIEIYLREIGLGFGYRFTITSIKAADKNNDVKQLLQELKKLSRTAGDLSHFDRWAVDLEEAGEDPRWTIVLRALISQTSASPSVLRYEEEAEKAIACIFLFDAIIAFRSDLTFFMAARGWFNTNYGTYDENKDNIKEKPFLSGFMLLSVRQKRFLANLSSNPDGEIGDATPLPEFVKMALKSIEFSATLLIEPGLIHFELGWPNKLRWKIDLGPLQAEASGGFIFRISTENFVLGISYKVRASLSIKVELDLGLVGVRIAAYAEVAYGARLIGIMNFSNPLAFRIYGAIGLEIRISLSLEFFIRIPLVFTTIEIDFNLSLAIGFTAGLEVAFGLNAVDRGLRGTGTLSLMAMGHSLEVSVKLALNEGAVESALAATSGVLNMGLEATDVEGVPGVPASGAGGQGVRAARVSGLRAAPMTAFAAPGARLGAATLKAAKGLESEAAEVIEFHLPDYSIFVIRKPAADGWSYFVIFPRGEQRDESGNIGSEPGFLPPPPLKLVFNVENWINTLSRGVVTAGFKTAFEAKSKQTLEMGTVRVTRRSSANWLLRSGYNAEALYRLALITTADGTDQFNVTPYTPGNDSAYYLIFPDSWMSYYFRWAIIGGRVDQIAGLYNDAAQYMANRFGIQSPTPDPFAQPFSIIEQSFGHAYVIESGNNLFRLQFQYDNPPVIDGADISQFALFTVAEYTAGTDFTMGVDDFSYYFQENHVPKTVLDTLSNIDSPDADALATVLSDAAEPIVKRENNDWFVTTKDGNSSFRFSQSSDQMIMQLTVTNDFELHLPPAYRFHVAYDLHTQLDAGTVPEGLFGEFANYSLPLARNPQPKIDVQTTGEAWQITDNPTGTLYTLRKAIDAVTSGDVIQVFGGVTIEHYQPAATWTALSTGQDAIVSDWKVNWDATLFKDENGKSKAKSYDVADNSRLGSEHSADITLADYLKHAYRLGDANNQVIPIGDPATRENPQGLEDDRVHNPSDNAFEAAVRGAVEQFEGSPFFKRDPNVQYDRMLGAAFQSETTVYNKQGIVPTKPSDTNLNSEAYKNYIASLRESQENQQATQLRGMVIHDMIADLREFVALPNDQPKQNAYLADSIPFQTGMVFRYKGQTPEWLDDLVIGQNGSSDKPLISQRKDTFVSVAATPAEQSVHTFNIRMTEFADNPPQFRRLQHYTNSSTIAITWDLVWTNTFDSDMTPAQIDPEQHLVHYEVRRRALDGRERELVYTVKPARVLHRNAHEDHQHPGDPSGMIQLRPRFQIVDHFTRETTQDLAALPESGRSYLYTITPVDFSGTRGRPLTLIATRYPDQSPLVPTNTELIVNYLLDKDILSPLNVNIPQMAGAVEPLNLSVEWSEPITPAGEPRIPVAHYQLIFRKEPTLPVGSYGLDSSTQRPRAKVLPTSNARPLPTDIKIPMELSDQSTDERKVAILEPDVLKQYGVFPADDSWQPEAWQVFIQTISINNVPSALAPVQLMLRAERTLPAGESVSPREERRPAELEWLASPLQFPILPAEDEHATPGIAHFPMPKVNNLTFNGDLSGIAYERHPAGIRCIRFRWNQGPSNQPDYPLDLNAGYQLLQLDIDANTNFTFNDPELLANALRQLQEIQMLPAADLLLEPGDTLATNQWEAWYPSAIRRLPDPDTTVRDGTRLLYKPWYSWRDSLLEWPPCPIRLNDNDDQGFVAAKGDTFNRLKALHPALQTVIDQLKSYKDPQGSAVYFVDRQISPPIQPNDLATFFKNTAPKNDPYGWGILQRLGLSVAFSVRRVTTGELVQGDDLLSAVKTALDDVKTNNATFSNSYGRHLSVELLFQPGKSVELSAGNSPSEEALLGIIQLGLRPVTRQVLQYGEMTFTSVNGGSVELSISMKQGKVVSFINQADRASGQQEIATDANLAVTTAKRWIKLPRNTPVTLLFRSVELPTLSLAIPLKAAPTNTMLTAFAGRLSFLDAVTAGNAFGSIQVTLGAVFKPEDDRQNLSDILGKDNADITNLIVTLSSSGLTGFSPTDESGLSTYFTAPQEALSKKFADTTNSDGGTQWLNFRRYVEAINGDEEPRIHIPVGEGEILALMSEFIDWSTRFFECGPDVVDDTTSHLAQTPDGSGPWLATAYPRAGSPAYATPDDSGRLKYDHLLEDQWAHNYRYYIRPYGRYDMLWQSFRLAPAFAPEPELMEKRKLADARPDVNSGGLDVVLDRVHPVDAPLILSSSRLDAPSLPGKAVPPGATWEVIIAQHPEQLLIERNQSLSRQLAFRGVAFTLLRHLTFPEWQVTLNTVVKGYNNNTDWNTKVDPREVVEVIPDLPGAYPVKPDHIDVNKVDLPEAATRALALPERIGNFQQGALVLQWDGVPFYYTHRLLTFAQTASNVSTINEITQRDFEYRSPSPSAEIAGIEVQAVHLRGIDIPLRRFWDSLPDSAQQQWLSEQPDDVDATTPAERKFSALPDPEVVYQIVEVFNGNIEVQVEYFFDATKNTYGARQQGKHFLGQITGLTPPASAKPHADFILHTGLSQISEDTLNTVLKVTADLIGKVSVDSSGKKIKVAGILRADEVAKLIAAIDPKGNSRDSGVIADKVTLQSLFTDWDSVEPISGKPDDLAKLPPNTTYDTPVSTTLVWYGAMSTDEKSQVLSLTGDQSFNEAVAGLARKASAATEDDVIRITVPNVLDIPAVLDGKLALVEANDESTYTGLSWTGLLGDSDLITLEPITRQWAVLPELQTAVTALLAALDARIIAETIPLTRPTQQGLPPDVREQLILPGKNSKGLAWNSPAPMESQRMTLGQLTGDDAFVKALKTLSDLWDADHKVKVPANIVAPKVRPSDALIDRLVLDAKPPFLTWKGPLTTDSERAVLDGWVQFLQALNALMAMIDSGQSVTIDHPGPIKDFFPDSVANQLIYDRDSHILSWQGPAPTDEQRKTLLGGSFPGFISEAIKPLMALIDADHTVDLSKTAWHPERDVLSDELKDQLVIDDKLTWKGPTPSDAQRDAFTMLAGISWLEALSALLAALDAQRNVALSPFGRRPSQNDLSDFFGDQLIIQPQSLTWSGRVHNPDQQIKDMKSLAAIKDFDSGFVTALNAIINELTEGVVTVSLDLPPRPQQADLPAELHSKLLIGRYSIRYHGLMLAAEGKSLQALFSEVLDKRAIDNLYASSLGRGMRGRQLKIRTRRGSATPTDVIPFEPKPLAEEA